MLAALGITVSVIKYGAEKAYSDDERAAAETRMCHTRRAAFLEMTRMIWCGQVGNEHFCSDNLVMVQAK